MAKKKNTQVNETEKMEIIDATVVETVEMEPQIEETITEDKVEEVEATIVEPIIKEEKVEVATEEIVEVKEIETPKPYQHEIKPNPHRKEIENNTTKLLNRSFGYSWNGQECEW